MPLRIATSSAAPSLIPASEAEARARLAALRATLAGACAHGDRAAVAAAFAEARTLAEAPRAYQATRELAEAFIAHPHPQGLASIELYATALSAVLTSLAERPAEPVLLNAAGVLLAELHQSQPARVLFHAALRLDPELALTKQNLRVVDEIRPAHVPGSLGNRLRSLGARACEIAKRATPGQGLTLSLVMIVKNEEEMLPGCLEAVAGAVDEIVVVDTGSSDRTREIAASFGARVLDVPWRNSFAEARNASLDAASGDWVMYLDADEHLVPEDAQELRRLLGRTWREGFYIVETNFTGSEAAGAGVSHAALRIWRNRPEYRFEGRIHEQITPSMPVFLPERFQTTPVRVRHFGYLKARINARGKSRRNLELLEREAREGATPFTWYNLGSEHLALGDVRRARDYLDRAYAAIEEEQDWHLRGFAPLLVRRTVSARREVGDLEAARAAIARGLEVYPAHTDLVFELALVERAAGDADAASDAALRCLELGDAPPHLSGTVGAGSFLALALLAELRTAAGDATGAEALYRRSLEQHPEYVSVVLPLAAAMLARGAEPAEVEALVPDRPSALLLGATALYEAGHVERAEQAFRRVLERQPENPVARIGLVEALLARSRFTEAAAEAALEPADSPIAARARAAELFAHAAAADAGALAAALDRAPVAPHLRPLFTAWQAGLEGAEPPASLPTASAPEAERYLEALLRVRAFDAFARLLPLYARVSLPARERRERLARIYFRRGFLDNAADEWIAAAREAPDASAFIGLAKVAHARGLPEDAELLAREAMRLEPSNETAHRLVAGLARAAA